MKYIFPKSFYWGASTSAHQVEGGLENDWTRWEKNNAARLAARAQNGHWHDWQKERFPEMTDPANYCSGPACRHFEMYEEDFDLAARLGHNAHRFSVDWSRIQPAPDKFDTEAIRHYQNVLVALRQRGIEPFLTLYHWPLPIWLADRGGWENPEIIEHFTKFSRLAAESFSGLVKFIITLNEPMVFTSYGYMAGQWPPGMKSVWKYYRVINNLISSHRGAYQIIKEIDPKYRIGISSQNTWFEAYHNHFVNRLLKTGADWWLNERFIRAIDQHQDFIGLNHYFRQRINFGWHPNPNRRVSDLGWELYPRSIYHALKELKKWQKPVYITENGLADADDRHRPWFIRHSLQSVWDAINEGVDVRGYLHWSLMDNFEWSQGFWPRFGLVEIDYQTMARKPRPSAFWYKAVCENNGF